MSLNPLDSAPEHQGRLNIVDLIRDEIISVLITILQICRGDSLVVLENTVC